MLWAIVPMALLNIGNIRDLFQAPYPHLVAFIAAWPLSVLILYFSASTRVSAAGVTRPFVGTTVEWSNIAKVAEGFFGLKIVLVDGGKVLLLKGLKRRELQAAVERFAPDGNPLRAYLAAA
jgi:hypothetical protein